MEIKAKCGVCNSRKMCIEERAEDFLPTSFCVLDVGLCQTQLLWMIMKIIKYI